jgi:hypothetical protein
MTTAKEVPKRDCGGRCRKRERGDIETKAYQKKAPGQQ